jgi:hypothetical protein
MEIIVQMIFRQQSTTVQRFHITFNLHSLSIIFRNCGETSNELGTLGRIPLGRMDTWSKGPLGRMDTWSKEPLDRMDTWSKGPLGLNTHF